MLEWNNIIESIYTKVVNSYFTFQIHLTNNKVKDRE